MDRIRNELARSIKERLRMKDPRYRVSPMPVFLFEEPNLDEGKRPDTNKTTIENTHAPVATPERALTPEQEEIQHRIELAERRVAQAGGEVPVSEIDESDRKEAELFVAEKIGMEEVSTSDSNSDGFGESTVAASRSGPNRPFDQLLRIRRSSGLLRNDGKVLREAATELLVKAMGIDIDSNPFAKVLSEKLMDGASEALADKLAERVPFERLALIAESGISTLDGALDAVPGPWASAIRNVAAHITRFYPVEDSLSVEQEWDRYRPVLNEEEMAVASERLRVNEESKEAAEEAERKEASMSRSVGDLP